MNTKVLTVHIHAGLDLIASRTSMRSDPRRGIEIELLPTIGVEIRSKKTNRTVIIPFGNIKGIEMMQEGAQVTDAAAIDHKRRGRPVGAQKLDG